MSGRQRQQTVSNDPWSGVQPYLTGRAASDPGSSTVTGPFGVELAVPHDGQDEIRGLLPEAARIYSESNGYSPLTHQAIDRLGTPTSFNIDSNAVTPFADGTSHFANKASGLIDRSTGFDFMSAYGDDILDNVDSRYAKSGRTGSGYHVDTAAKELGGVASRLYSDDRNRELAAAGLYNQMDNKALSATLANPSYMGQIESLNDAETAQMLQAGQMLDDEDWDSLRQYAGIVAPMAGAGSVQTQPGGSQGAGILGGAMSGAGLGSMMALSNPWTAGLAIGGGILGGL